MKKIILGLLVVLLCSSFGGVVFADVAQDANGKCPDGYSVIGDGKCSSLVEFCANQLKYYIPEINKEECVTRQQICESVKGSFYDSEKDTCIGGVDFCAKKKETYNDKTFLCEACTDPEKFDPVMKNCYDPNLTPATLLPNTDLKETDCEKLFQYEAYTPGTLQEIVSSGIQQTAPLVQGGGAANIISPLDVLGCAIKTGRIHLWMIPFYIKYFIQFGLSLAGLVAVGAVIIGGYFYLFGSFADDKDKGKRAIIYGIAGFVVAILAWTIVNVVISIATR